MILGSIIVALNFLFLKQTCAKPNKPQAVGGADGKKVDFSGNNYSLFWRGAGSGGMDGEE